MGYNFSREAQLRELDRLKAPLVGKDVVIEIHVPTDAAGNPSTTGGTTMIYKGQYTDVSRYTNSRIVEYVETGYSTPLNIATNYSFGGTLAKGDVDDVLSQIAFGTTKLTRSGGRLFNSPGDAGNDVPPTETILDGDRPYLTNATAYDNWQRSSQSAMTINPYILKIFKAYTGSAGEDTVRSGTPSGGESIDFSKDYGRVHIYEEVVFSNFRAVSNAGSDISTHVVDWYASGWEIQELA